MPADTLIEVRDLTKRYGGVVALADMNLTVERGTVHAVVGENGAGKSTLMKILAGAVRPDAGTIALDGEAVTLDSPNAARKRGIGIVYQELSLFPERSVLANLFVNREPSRASASSRRGRWKRRAATCSPASASMSTCTRPVGRAHHRRAAARRARPRAPRGAAADHPRRAQLGAQRARDAAALRRAPAAPAGAATPCSTSRTGSRRCSPSPTG